MEKWNESLFYSFGRMNSKKNIHISKLKIRKVPELDLSDFEEHKSSLDFSNPLKVLEWLTEHFMEGEYDTFFEILALYLDHIGKSEISRSTKIPERTIYNFIRGAHVTSSENIFKIMKYISDKAKSHS